MLLLHQSCLIPEIRALVGHQIIKGHMYQLLKKLENAADTLYIEGSIIKISLLR